MSWQFRLAIVMFALGASIVRPSIAGAHDHHYKVEPVKRSIVQAKITPVTLVREDGVKIDLAKELQDPRPTYLNFIFTSCTTVCPVMSQIFSALQDKLVQEREKVRMMSVSIDPEHDTPARLTLYAQAFGAVPSQWRFYTGTHEASLAVQRAFGVLGLDKMNHPVATFFRTAPNQPWVRIDGFASADVLEHEYRTAVAR
jgi:protein SCO1/2